MNRRGITLIELLVYIGVTTIFLLAVSGAMFSLLATSRQTDVLKDQRIELRLLAERIKMLVEQSYASGVDSQFNTNLAATPNHLTFLRRDPVTDPAIVTVQDGVIQAEYGNGFLAILSSEQHRVVSFSAENRSNGPDQAFAFTLTMETAVGYGIPPVQQTIAFTALSLDYAP